MGEKCKMDNDEILLKTLEKEKTLLENNFKKFKEEKDEEIKVLRSENERLKNDIKDIRSQLDVILNSRTYKFSLKLRNIIK